MAHLQRKRTRGFTRKTLSPRVGGSNAASDRYTPQWFEEWADFYAEPTVHPSLPHHESNQDEPPYPGFKFKPVESVNEPPPPHKRRERNNWKFKLNGAPRPTLGSRIFNYLSHMSLWMTLILFIIVSAVICTVFALLLWAHPDGCCGDPEFSFADNFNFALQTFSTIGYGTFSPVGFYQNVLVFFIFICGITITTILAGLVFTKFIEPKINIMWSNVVSMHNAEGLPCLHIRIANADGEQGIFLQELHAKIYCNFYASPHAANKHRNTVLLRLEQHKRPELKAIWTIRHFVDSDSPFYGKTLEELKEANFVLTVVIMGTLASTSDTIFRSTMYWAEDIMVGSRFQDQVSWVAETETLHFDFHKMSEIEPSPCYMPQKIQDGAYFESDVESNELDDQKIVQEEDFCSTKKQSIILNCDFVAENGEIVSSGSQIQPTKLASSVEVPTGVQTEQIPTKVAEDVRPAGAEEVEASSADSSSKHREEYVEMT